MAAIAGGGKGAKPGKISLAHKSVPFMDEFPEYRRGLLETLRQPIETGNVVVARTNAHVKYPCKLMLIAAASPCNPVIWRTRRALVRALRRVVRTIWSGFRGR